MAPGLGCLFLGENLALLIHLRPFTLHTDLRGITYRAVGEFSGSDCSGLMKPDTLLGENTRQIEVSDDQTTPYLFR